MTTDVRILPVWPEWITLCAAIATVLLAATAFRAIWQTRNIHRKERVDRLMHDVTDWGLAILNLDPEGKTRIGNDAFLNQILRAIMTLLLRGEYIARIRIRLSPNLQIAVDNTMALLVQHGSLIDLLQQGKAPKTDSVETHRRRPDASAKDVLAEAAKMLSNNL